MELSLKEVFETEDVPQVFLAFVEAKAVHDVHYKKINNGYQKGTPEFDAYQNKVNELTEKTQWKTSK